MPFPDLSGPNPWGPIEARVIVDTGRMALYEDTVTQPDGSPGTYHYIQLPYPIVAIVPVTDDARVYLVRQWRYPWGSNSWEIPAGHCEAGEEPIAAARRELAEEAGVGAAEWLELGQLHSSASIRGDYHLYLARGLSPLPGFKRDLSEQDMVIDLVPFNQALQAAIDGQILHSLTATALLRATRHVAGISR